MTTRVDISVGPVQGFVSQSRRTRDLWGSSYLLAFLSAHAMHGAHMAGGRIVQPVVAEDPLYRWVSGNPTDESPRIGSVPNHFVIELDGDAADVRPVADAAVVALDDAWMRVCDSVWGRFVEHACAAGNGTEAIWRRQVRGFWEVSWAAGPSDGRDNLLARRKHWRSHQPPVEPGDKCTVMHHLQEVSGHTRPASGRQQDRFWQRLGSRLGKLDLRDNERLCAVALVKRLFPKPEAARDALGWSVDASHWPSTVYVGAVPWMRRVVETVPDQAREYAAAVRSYAGRDLLPMERAAFTDLNLPAAGEFAKLDANYLHREFLTSERLRPVVDGATDGVRRELDERLRNLYAAQDAQGRQIGPPSTFYALLLADGDRLGTLVSGLGGPVVSDALASFTSGVPEVVAQHHGVTVYAGGDDVLAMLPVRDAMNCAAAVSSAYRAAFAETDVRGQATLSAAVVFAHVRLPLRSVLDQAHRLLDDVAKAGNGRDSLAAAVLKPGGLHCQWVTTWKRSEAGGTDAIALFDDLVRQLGASTAEAGLSSALIYRMREMIATLCGWDRWEPGAWGVVPAGIELRPFLHAEICHSLEVRMGDGARKQADILADHVCALLGQAHATEGNAAKAGLDALLLARFVADPTTEEARQ